MIILRSFHAAILSIGLLIAGCNGANGSSAPLAAAPLAVIPPAVPATAALPPPSIALPSPLPPPAPPLAAAPPATAAPPPGADVVSEGDSISVFWGGNHTGIYAGSRPTIAFKGMAVGGSGLDGLRARSAAVLALRPRVFTVFIGANDLANHSSARDYVAALFAYTSAIRAGGARIAVATILPQSVAGSDKNNALHNAKRAEANALIRAAVGREIDAVIDFAADPMMGPDQAASDKALYQDGLHPTDGGCGLDCGGQGRLARIYQAAVDPLLAAMGL